MPAKLVFTDKDTFLDGFEAFASGKLQHPLITGAVAGALVEKGEIALLEELSFSAKYVTGLFRVLESAAGNPEISNTDAMRKDFSAAVEKSVELLGSALQCCSLDIAASVEQGFMQLSGESFGALLALLSDFGILKSYLNEVKRSG